MIEVVAFPGSFADAGEDRIAAVLDSDVADEFHHVDGLAHASAAEQADLAALGEGADQIDNLDTRLEQFIGRRLILKGRRLAVNAPAGLFAYGPLLIDGIAENVHDPAQGFLADRNGDCRAGVGGCQPALQTVGAAHGNGSDHAVTQLLLHLEHQSRFLDAKGVIDFRQGLAGELNVYNGTDNLYDFARTHGCPLKTLLRDSIVGTA